MYKKTGMSHGHTSRYLILLPAIRSAVWLTMARVESP